MAVWSRPGTLLTLTQNAKRKRNPLLSSCLDVWPEPVLPPHISRSFSPTCENSTTRPAVFEPEFEFEQSYGAKFKYSDLKLSKQSIPPTNGQLEVSFTVTNTGTLPAEEVVQLYIRDEISSVRFWICDYDCVSGFAI